jgi:signal transduction histidine kinase
MSEVSGNGLRAKRTEAVPSSSTDSQAPILIVDDTRDNLMLFSSMLKPLGQPVVAVSSGPEALAACRENDFAVILLDVQMPEMDGFEVASRIRNSDRGQRTPIIFVTALHTDETKVHKGYSLGAVDYLFKPVVLSVLRAKVAAFIDLFRQQKVLRQALARAQEAEHKLSEQAVELRRSNEELEQFAYVASHDLKEPLRMVTSYVQLLGRRYQGKLDSDADEFIAFATEGAERMRALIDDLLKYSRVGTRGAPFAPTDCNAILDAVLSNLEVAIEESGAEVQVDELPTLVADPRQLEQVFQNLIANAVKFRGEAAPQVTVSARRYEEESLDGRLSSGWKFSISDNGIGLDPQFAEKIFLIFQRLHHRGEYGGTGIGLAVCKKIVERHGGRISVESKPGTGATFQFTIPDRINGHAAVMAGGEETEEACRTDQERAA